MKIERIDENTVKCYISSEEMQEHNLDYKDFLTRSDKARELVQEIVMQAEVEVGFKPPKFSFDLQIMILPDKGLVLTLSELEPNISDKDKIMQYLSEMKKSLMEVKENLSQTDPTPPVQLPVKHPEFAVFVFSTLRKVMEYVAALPANLRVESSLYKMDNYYYLYFLKGHVSSSRYTRACIQALEFAGLYATEQSHTIYLEEHGECLIAEKAIKKLRG